jgi:preprotein translocase subunit YajC
MHALYHFIAATTTATTTSGSKKSKSSSEWPLLILIVLFAGGYLLFIRPRQQRMKQQQQAARQLAVGDPVVTAGGIHGKIVGLDANVAEVEVAPGVVLTVLTRSVSLHPYAPLAGNRGGTASGQSFPAPPNPNGNPASAPSDADVTAPKPGEEDENLPPAGDA